MPIVAISIRLDRIEEELLYQAKAGRDWLTASARSKTDAKGRMVVAQLFPGNVRRRGERPAGGLLARDRRQDKPAAREGGASTWPNTRPLPRLMSRRPALPNTPMARKGSRRKPPSMGGEPPSKSLTP